MQLHTLACMRHVVHFSTVEGTIRHGVDERRTVLSLVAYILANEDCHGAEEKEVVVHRKTQSTGKESSIPGMKVLE